MLYRHSTKHGALSLLLQRFHSSSTLSSKPDTALTAIDTITKPPKPSKIRKPTSLSAPIPRVLDTVSPQVNAICSLLCNHSQQTVTIDNLLKCFKENLSSNLVLQILMNYRQLGRIKTLEFFSWAGLQMGFKFDDSVIEYMADFLGRRKLFDDMKCLLVTVFSCNGQISSRTFSICIRFLGRQGRIREALCLFEEMESKFRCKPDNFVYNNMLYVLCKKESSGQLIDLALTIFRRIELPDTYSYSNVIIGLCKFGRFETALEVFVEMYRAGLVPTRSVVNVLIGKLCSLSEKEGEIAKVRVKSMRRPFTILVPNVGVKSGTIQPTVHAVQVFWAVHHLGLLPSSFVIIQLISELCRLGKTEEAVEILKVVEDMKRSCLEESYSIVMKALCKHHLVEEASHLFGRMLSQGVKPKLSDYNSVICMLCKIGNLDGAERVYKIMSKNRCLPDSLTYSVLIHAYVEARNWEAAYGLLIEMLGLGLSPHFHTHSAVDKLLRENGKMVLCHKLERKLESQNLLKLCKENRLQLAYEKLNSMLEKGCYPPAYVRDAFEHAFEKRGKLQMAREVLGKMDKTQKTQGEKLKVS
ncbi:pentatricopeptide repeat-containing protein At1g12775, mitochondrial isoform X2 [Ziziphus jujuba]|uniref:Pentatricopeptide repeat-containing protein At1g12775, mitochondrial isoform X2 n=2 Tax=Ziziphus jujuba TaxID=326968 RepID=A0A6P6GLJ3_ZIZJJ|nr:pentatricopeptide repeat-containing protein At1g12775, mitochondrial isoform X2 [Ziziphus jujuba]XP_060674511.1 pentatricopeptide repeat-containing protein At1g12775, mitochondrial isoform X2 [Ziziphus jujuba]KAH7514452.1 hypothetical protein FEM48_Zijuj11G0091100 [Ziziphus jujuba var. spinosa]